MSDIQLKVIVSGIRDFGDYKYLKEIINDISLDI